MNSYKEEVAFTCMRCGCDYPQSMMDYEHDDTCIYCAMDDERPWSLEEDI